MQCKEIENFISAVERLEGYRFFRETISSQIAWVGMVGGDPENDQIRIGPTREETDAALLIIRQLIQNNDAISIGNISKTAEKYLTPEAKAKIEEIRNELNGGLDSYPPLGEKRIIKKYREILNEFLYGEYAHTKCNPRQGYLSMSSSGLQKLYEHYFTVALRAVVICAICIKNILSNSSSYV